MSDYKTPLTGPRLQDTFERIKKEEEKRIEELEKGLKSLLHKVKNPPSS